MDKLRVLGARCYSSGGVSNEFLQQILAKAQQITAQKASLGIRPMPFKKKARKAQNANNRQNVVKGSQYLGSAAVNTGRGDTNGGLSESTKQPQFAKQNQNTKQSILSKVDGDQLLDAVDSKPLFAGRNTIPRRNKGDNKRLPRSAKQTTKFAKTAKPSKPTFILATGKHAENTTYVPNKVSLIDLLKYNPDLYHTKESRLVEFALDTLKENGYPVNKNVNFGVSAEAGIENHYFTCSNENFGSYNGGKSLDVIKEKLHKNIQVAGDTNDFATTVRGDYQKLAELKGKEFEALTKNKDKIKDLIKNSEAVRLALQNSNSNISFERKQTIMKVCSGLTPPSQLSN